MLSDLAEARRLVDVGRSVAQRGEPRAGRRPERLSVCPTAIRARTWRSRCARSSRRSRTAQNKIASGTRAYGRARGAHGRPRQLGGDPLADRPRRLRRAGGGGGHRLERCRQRAAAASDTAYRGVRQPVEGTILTVVREMAEEAEARAPSEPELDELLRGVLARGADALARTPDLLDVLREANVVDAGGAGLVEIARGIVAAVTGEELALPGYDARSAWRRSTSGSRNFATAPPSWSRARRSTACRSRRS